jgi:hypothetical protein
MIQRSSGLTESMHLIDTLSLEVHEGPYATWPLKSRLFSNGDNTGMSIPGYVIEAQYKCVQGYLVITSYDCMFEESNEFLLLDECFNIIAKKSMPVSNNIYAHWPISDNAIRIHELNDSFYTLQIQPRVIQLWRQYKLTLQRIADFQNDETCLASANKLNALLKEIRTALTKQS